MWAQVEEAKRRKEKHKEYLMFLQKQIDAKTARTHGRIQAEKMVGSSATLLP
jgi:hypothetical protein